MSEIFNDLLIFFGLNDWSSDVCSSDLMIGQLVRGVTR